MECEKCGQIINDSAMFCEECHKCSDCCSCEGDNCGGSCSDCGCGCQ